MENALRDYTTLVTSISQLSSKTYKLMTVFSIRFFTCQVDLKVYQLAADYYKDTSATPLSLVMSYHPDHFVVPRYNSCVGLVVLSSLDS